LQAYGGVEIQFHAFLTSTLGGGKWTVLRPSCYITYERKPIRLAEKAEWGPEPALCGRADKLRTTVIKFVASSQLTEIFWT
jgi:hypothetical protein